MLRLSMRLAALMSALFIMSSAPVFAGVPVQSLKQTGSITAPANFAALSPDESKLYVVNQVGANFAAKLTVIDATTNTLAGSLDLGLGFVFEIALTPAGDRAYIAISKSSGSNSVSDPGRVAVVDVSQSPPVLVTTITSGLGATPSGITVDPRPTAQRAYVADRGTGRIYVIDTSTNSVLSSFPSGGSRSEEHTSE